MRTYVNTFSNVTTKVLTYSHLQSLTQGFGLGPASTHELGAESLQLLIGIVTLGTEIELDLRLGT